MTSIQKASQSAPMVMDDDDVEIHSPESSSAALEIAQTREMQEVQAAMTIAKKFPRDENTAYARVMSACKRPRLAEISQYEFPRGGEKITGPSIKLAQEIARCWGNIQYGVTEIARRRGFSECIAWAWDLETNVRPMLTFTVRHQRDTRKGIVILTDERDIMELILNQGSRRLRSCLLRVIPSDITDDAVEQCNKTLAAADGATPLADRVRKMVAAFADYGVTTEMIKGRLGHEITAMSEAEFASLRKTYQGIRDGATSAAEAFAAQIEPTAKETEKKARTAVLKEQMKAQAEAAKEAGPPAPVVAPVADASTTNEPTADFPPEV